MSIWISAKQALVLACCVEGHNILCTPGAKHNEANFTIIEDFSKDCLGSRRGIRPRAAGPMPAFVLSVSDEQDAAFLVSVMDCSDCDSSGLDSPNSSWSIARLKENLRRKRGQVNGKKAELLERDNLH